MLVRILLPAATTTGGVDAVTSLVWAGGGPVAVESSLEGATTMVPAEYEVASPSLSQVSPEQGSSVASGYLPVGESPPEHLPPGQS